MSNKLLTLFEYLYTATLIGRSDSGNEKWYKHMCIATN